MSDWLSAVCVWPNFNNSVKEDGKNKEASHTKTLDKCLPNEIFMQIMRPVIIVQQVQIAMYKTQPKSL